MHAAVAAQAFLLDRRREELRRGRKALPNERASAMENKKQDCVGDHRGAMTAKKDGLYLTMDAGPSEAYTKTTMKARETMVVGTMSP